MSADGVEGARPGKTRCNLATVGKRKREVLVFASERKVNLTQDAHASRIDFCNPSQVENDSARARRGDALYIFGQRFGAAEKSTP